MWSFEQRRRKEVGEAVQDFLGQLEPQADIIPLSVNLKSTKDVRSYYHISLNGSAQNEPRCPEELDLHVTGKIL